MPGDPPTREPLGAVYLGTLIFIAALYLVPSVFLVRRLDLWPKASWGHEATFAVICSAGYVACVLGVVTVTRLAGSDLSERMGHRTGLVGIEPLVVLLGVVGCVLTWRLGYVYLPLALAALLPPLISLPAAVYRRPVGGTRIIYVPPHAPPLWLEPPELGPDGELPPGFELREYAWTFDPDGAPEQFAVSLPVNMDLYGEMCEMNEDQSERSSEVPNPFARRAVGGITSDVLRLADALVRISESRSMGPLNEIGLAYSFVQDNDNIAYADDLSTKGQPDYWRYPLETLVERQGDCECKSILLASMLVVMGHHVVMLEMWPKDGGDGHVAVGIEAPEGIEGAFVSLHGRKYFYCETTAGGWRLGNLPPGTEDSEIKAHELVLEDQ